MTANSLESGQPLSPSPEGQPGGAEGAGVSQPSTQAPVFTPEQERFIEQLIGRATQSLKDRRIAGLETAVEGMKDTLARYEEYRARGLKPEQARREMLVDDLLSNRPPASPGTASAASTYAAPAQAPAPVDYAAIYQAVGLSGTDNDVVRLTVEHAANPDKLKSALVDLKTRRNGQPSPSPTQAVSLPGGAGAGGPARIEQIEAEMITLARQPAANAARIRELQVELLGLRK